MHIHAQHQQLTSEHARADSKGVEMRDPVLPPPCTSSTCVERIMYACMCMVAPARVVEMRDLPVRKLSHGTFCCLPLLPVLSDWNGSPGLTAKEERRVRKLLANASQDRAWRRRGLPVLCRAFPDRCLLEQEHPKDSTQARAVWIEPVPIPRKRQKLTSRLVFESRSTKTRGVKDLGSSVDDGEGTGERTSNDAPEFSRLTARLLLTLQEENVFRHVVEYL